MEHSALHIYDVSDRFTTKIATLQKPVYMCYYDVFDPLGDWHHGKMNILKIETKNIAPAPDMAKRHNFVWRPQSYVNLQGLRDPMPHFFDSVGKSKN